MTVRAIDVAAYILLRKGAMSAMKLQKLVYYSQAWSLVWDDEPLFRGRTEAWANGPVVPRLYEAHRGKFKVSNIPGGHSRKLNEVQRETVDAVVDFYGDKSPFWLSELTHQETPWKEAREKAGLSSGEHGYAKITHQAMEEYYAGLLE